MTVINTTVNKTFVIDVQGENPPFFSACTALYTNEVVSCDGDAVIILGTGSTIFNSDIVPVSADTINIGTPINRFRNINTVSGTTTVWIATIKTITPELDLGLDSSGNTRTITANNSIINDDFLFGGNY